MDRQEQAKQKFIQTMQQLFPDNKLVQQSVNEAEQDSFHGIVNQMIMGMAYGSEYDALIPALQEAMDALREVRPETNKSAEQTIIPCLPLSNEVMRTLQTSLSEPLEKLRNGLSKRVTVCGTCF